MSTPGKKNRIFYGWWIVGLTFVTHFTATGFIFYSYGAFFIELVRRFGWSHAQVGLGLSIIHVVTAVAAPFIGRTIDRRGARSVMIIGAVFLGVGFALLSQVQTLWQYYGALIAFVGIGGACMGGLASNTLLAKWFVSRRGLAFGIATMGVSLSGVVMVPLVTWLVAVIGLRWTYGTLSASAFIIVIPIVARFAVNRPETIGLRPDGAAVPRSKPDGEPMPLPAAPGDALHDHPELHWTTLRVLRAPAFWYITLAAGFAFMSLSAILTHTIPYLTGLGLTASEASYALGLTAASGVLGKILFGTMSDRADLRLAIVLSFVLQVGGLAVLMNVDSARGVWLFSVMFGIGMGGVVPLIASAVGQCFGRAAFGSVAGLSHAIGIPIHILGVPLAGYIYDVTGSYDAAFKTFLVAYAVAALLALFLPVRRPSGTRGPAA